MDRNYDGIKEIEGKVDRNLYVLHYGLDRNYDAIKSVEGKVDRNLSSMLAEFEFLENRIDKTMDEIKEGFKKRH